MLADCSLFVVGCLLVVCCSLVVLGCWLFVAVACWCCRFYVVCCMLFVGCNVRLAARGLLIVENCLLPVG